MDPSPTDLAAPTCLVCRKPVSELPVVTCTACETAIHHECHEYLGGCGRFACVEAATPRTRVVKYLESRLRQRFQLRVGLFVYLLVTWLRACRHDLDEPISWIILGVQTRTAPDPL